MDVTLLALPQTQDRLARVIAHGRDALTGSAPSQETRVQLAVDAALLDESDFARVKGSLDTSLNEDANFYGVRPEFAPRIKKAREGYEAATAKFVAMTREIASGRPTFDAAAWNAGYIMFLVREIGC